MMTLLLEAPQAAVTPLHHDNMNVLLAQVMGRKHIKLIPSLAPPDVPRYGTFSHVDAARPDADRFPLYSEAHVVGGAGAPASSSSSRWAGGTGCARST